MPISTMPIRNFNLKVIFLVHFAFIALSLMGFWSGNAFIFYNAAFIVLLLWSIHHDSNPEPMQLAIMVNGISFILDILLLIMCFPDSNRAREKFSAAMCILHLIVRPFSTILLVKNLEERTNSNDGGLFAGRDTYEDIDRNVPQTSGAKNGGYNFATAEQI